MGPGMMPRAVPPSRAWGWLIVAMLVIAAPADARSAHRKGELVTITGQVRDAEGAPVAQATVVLEATRRSFKVLRFARETSPAVQVPTRTDANGQFSLQWAWDGYHNRFSLSVAESSRRGGDMVTETFASQDISDLMRQGGPVQSNLEVADASAIRWLRQFETATTSAEERKVYEELGRPDRVDVVGTAGRGTGQVSWWYFEQGKVYRFRGGALEQVVHFEPVLPVE